MRDNEYEQLLEDFSNLTNEYRRLYDSYLGLKDLLYRIKRYYPGQVGEVITEQELKDLENDY